MREFLLVVPDLMSSPKASRTDAGSVGRALRFGATAPVAGGWRSWLAHRLARPELDGLPLASVVALAARATSTAMATSTAAGIPVGATRAEAAQVSPGASSAAAAEACWLATPLHLVAGLDTLHLPRDGILSLAPDERAELAADFTDALGGGRLSLHVVDGDALLLRGLAPGEVSTWEPSACLGADLVRAQPTGPGATRLRQLMAEIEMWLHEHPVNRRRERQGLRPVRSLWLWGGEARAEAAPAGATGGAVPGSRDAARAGPIRRIHSTDAWVRAAARLAAAPLAPQGEVAGEGDFGAAGDLIATASLHDADLPDLESFEARHLAPALAALQAGRLERVTLLSADRRVTLAASDRYRVWRPRRPWLTALGEQG